MPRSAPGPVKGLMTPITSSSARVSPLMAIPPSTANTALAHRHLASSMLRSLVSYAEIGTAYVFIYLDGRGCTVGDHFAPIKYGDAVTDPHDHVHVVFDEQQGQAAMA